MTRVLMIGSFLAIFNVLALGASARPTLSNGVVTYTDERGRRETIRLGKRCVDLWVAPDESVMAFIAVEKERPWQAQEIESFIEESSIYIARKSDHFKPVRMNVNLLIDGRIWSVAREPKVSPDGRQVYFLVPNTTAAWTLM